MPTPPTLISYTEVPDWNAGASSKGVTISWNSGDVIVVIAGSEANDTLANPTATGLTFTSQKSNTTASTCGTQLATAVAGAGGSGVTVTVNNNSSGSNHWGFGCWVWRGSAGVGNSSESHTTAKTVSLTPTGADGGIVYATFDFNADAVQTITPTPTDQRQRANDAGHYTFYVSDITDQTSSGAVSYGVTGGGSTGPFSHVALEVKAAAGGGGGFEPDEDFWPRYPIAEIEPIISVW